MKRSFLILFVGLLCCLLIAATTQMTLAEPSSEPEESSEEITSELEESSEEYSEGESSDSEESSEEISEEISGEFSGEESEISIDWEPVSEEVSYAPSRNYYLTVTTSGNGTVNTKVNGSYAAGEQITLSAQADEGYVFSRWKSDNGILANAFAADTEFYMPVGNATVEAVFVKEGEETASEETSTEVIHQKGWRIPYKFFFSMVGLVVFSGGLTAVLIVVYRKRKSEIEA